MTEESDVLDAFAFDYPKSVVVSHLSAEHREMLESKASSLTIKKGHSLFIQNDKADALYIVHEGAIEISLFSEDGKKLSLNVMRSGDVLGEIATLDGGVRTANATALSTTKLLRVSRTDLFDLILLSPSLTTSIISILCERVRWISQQVEDFGMLDLEGRLAHRLLLLSDKFADASGTVRISQSELADFLGASREATNKVLQAWKIDGKIELSRGAMRILRRGDIRTLARLPHI